MNTVSMGFMCSTQAVLLLIGLSSKSSSSSRIILSGVLVGVFLAEANKLVLLKLTGVGPLAGVVSTVAMDVALKLSRIGTLDS